MQLKHRLWIEDKQHRRMMGEGVASLLRAIDQTGSINQAAARLKMSYRNAWAKIEKTEDRLGFKLVLRKTGGAEGGGTSLTPEGRLWLERFTDLQEDVAACLDTLYCKHFPPDTEEKD